MFLLPELCQHSLDARHSWIPVVRQFQRRHRRSAPRRHSGEMHHRQREDGEAAAQQLPESRHQPPESMDESEEVLAPQERVLLPRRNNDTINETDALDFGSAVQAMDQTRRDRVETGRRTLHQSLSSPARSARSSSDSRDSMNLSPGQNLSSDEAASDQSPHEALGYDMYYEQRTQHVAQLNRSWQLGASLEEIAQLSKELARQRPRWHMTFRDLSAEVAKSYCNTS